MTGIRERRFWETPVLASEAAARAGEKVLRRTRFDREDFDLLIHAAVCRDRLEPATAAYVHRRLGLSGKAQICDVSNACLGFLNAVVLAGGLIESGQIQRALIVAGEDGRPLVERTIDVLLKSHHDRDGIKPYFANLTIGAGAAAAALCHESLAPEPVLRLISGIAETDTSRNDLCEGGAVGGGYEMQTASEELLHAGIAVAQRAWLKFKRETGWNETAPDRCICHQVGRAHQRELYGALGIDTEKDFPSYPLYGNIGSVSLPLTLALALEQGALKPGRKTVLMGIGSGLSSIMLAAEAGQGNHAL